MQYKGITRDTLYYVSVSGITYIVRQGALQIANALCYRVTMALYWNSISDSTYISREVHDGPQRVGSKGTLKKCSPTAARLILSGCGLVEEFAVHKCKVVAQQVL